MDTTETSPSPGRPRSVAARTAVLHAVDDLLVEDGYAAMTMKGIAARAGVSRQTVYRWWSSKAEILLEAVAEDAATELVPGPASSSAEELDLFLDSVADFLTTSHAGAAYRALVGEAQHDPKVATLIRASDVLVAAAIPVLRRAISRGDLPSDLDVSGAAVDLVAPTMFRVFTGLPGAGSPTSGSEFLARYASHLGPGIIS